MGEAVLHRRKQVVTKLGCRRRNEVLMTHDPLEGHTHLRT